MRNRRWLFAAGLLASAVIGASCYGGTASAEAERTIGKWLVACAKTEAGGNSCELRNDEAGKPALEQSRLLSFALHAGSSEAEGLVRIADLELAPRLGVQIALGDRTLALEGVGRHGRLVARFTLPRSELANLATAGPVRVRFADRQAKPQEVTFPTAGLAKALAFANDHL